jgi:hypothetical protein
MGTFEAKLGPAGDPGFKALVEAEAGRTYACRVPLSHQRRRRTRGGPDQLLWGGDWPHANTDLDRTRTYAKMLQSLAEWVPDAAIRRKILVDTPTRLLAFACGRARGAKAYSALPTRLSESPL